MAYKKVDYEKFLVSVENPARYIDNEPGAYKKKISDDTVNFCFAFPDVYEVGFSHLGIKILYSIINDQPDAAADRAYAPWKDFGNILKANDLPLFGIESSISIKDFDVLGITLQTELTFTNVLYLLELSQIPIFSADRKNDDALVIGGGSAISNPECMADFFDIIFIGDAEEAIIEMKDVIKTNKNADRIEKLRQLSKIQGVYVPAFYKEDNGRIIPDGDYTYPIKIRKFMDFNNPKFLHKNQLVPWLKPTHERYVAEIMRGCSRGCRFCQAGMYYRPVRERDSDMIIENLLENVQTSGWTEVALTSLSSSDYTNIKPLLIKLYDKLKKSNTSISLPSLRVDSLDDEITKLLNAMRQTGLTIAPEAGSQRLRDIINKNISEEEILNGVEIALKNGWKTIKLYFMLGLPFETDEDIEELILLLNKIIKESQRKLKINISLSPFVPKAHTPFQWAKVLDKETLLKRIYMIKRAFQKQRFVKIKYHTLETSMLEAIIGRGDRKISNLIYHAYKNGAIFDGWNEFFNFDYWEKAAQKLSIDIDEHLKEIDLDATLNWEHIDITIDKKFLISEWNKSKEAATTQDCRTAPCTLCGACDKTIRPQYTPKEDVPEVDIIKEEKISNNIGYYYRVFYAKTGKLRFISHLDMLRMIQRFIRISDIPIKYSSGYSIRPMISLSPPLSVGIEGENEYFDITLNEKPDSDLLLKELQSRFKSILQITSGIYLEKKAMRSMEFYPYEKIKVVYNQIIDNDFHSYLSDYKNATEWTFERTRKGKTTSKDLKEFIVSIEIKDNILWVTKKRTGASIFDILSSIFKIEREKTNDLKIVRIRFISDGELSL